MFKLMISIEQFKLITFNIIDCISSHSAISYHTNQKPVQNGIILYGFLILFINIRSSTMEFVLL